MSREYKDYINTKHLSALLRFRDLNQKEAAKLCGISENQFSRIINEGLVTNSALNRIARGLNIRPDFLTAVHWDVNTNLDDPTLSWRTWIEESRIEWADSNRNKILSDFILLVAADCDYEYYECFNRLPNRMQEDLYDIIKDIVRFSLNDKGVFLYFPDLEDIVARLENF